MFNPTQIVIEAFIDELRETYDRNYGTLEPGFPGVIGFVAQLALENIATSDAPYHDVHHTIMVTLVGQETFGANTSVSAAYPRATGCTSSHRYYVTTSAMCEEFVRAMKMVSMSPPWRETRWAYRKAPLMHR